MKLNTFYLTMENVSMEDIAIATFSGLKAQGWSLYNAGLMMHLTSNGISIRDLDEATKIMIARKSFDFIADELPASNPFAQELRRYIKEALPSDVPSAPLSPWLFPDNGSDG
jgi:hypothetical protein